MADDQKQTQDAGQADGGAGETPVQTWDAWLGGQSDDVRALYETHTAGLRNALDTERKERRAMEKQLREALKGAEQGSALEKQLSEMAAALDGANRRADYLTDAAKLDTPLIDLEIAWRVISAEADEFIGKSGRVDFKRVRERYPALFTTPRAVKANAGNGAGQDGAGKASFNDWIRQQARKG